MVDEVCKVEKKETYPVIYPSTRPQPPEQRYKHHPPQIHLTTAHSVLVLRVMPEQTLKLLLLEKLVFSFMWIQSDLERPFLPDCEAQRPVNWISFCIHVHHAVLKNRSESDFKLCCWSGRSRPNVILILRHFRDGDTRAKCKI